MSGPRILVTGALAALAILALMIALLAHLQTFDPYGWAVPGVESVESRNLYLRRRSLYMMTAAISFSAAVTLGFASLLLKRRRKLS